MRTRKPKEPAEKVDWIERYPDGRILGPICSGMIVFGLEEFKGAYIIQHLDKLEALLDKKDRGEISIEEFGQAMAPFMFYSLSDSIRICVFFENYMKAILMSERMIVHQFASERLKPLGKRQSKRPIVNRYFVKCHIEPREISEQTIGMGTMLNNKYQEIIKLPEDVLAIVREINSSRNELHFRPSIAGEYGRSTIADLRRLNEFAEPWVKKAVEASRDCRV
ncbi:MAG TPA: hypothetical protein PKE53_11975 [Flavobacteriales bacterium]|nr:hypothetical protein [Flavobacteriales bacterium]